jgi:5-methylcytosine-specific restriction endonuclease McrA
METKICTKCKIEKPFSEFHKGNDKNRLCYWCKPCCKQYNKDNAPKKAIYNKQYNKNNAIEIAKQRKQYQKDNAPKISEQKKQYNKQHNKNNALFKTYSKKLKIFEEIRKCPENLELLEVKCSYCGKWMKPTNLQTKSRIQVFNGRMGGELRFYCSENCKLACPTYDQNKYPKGFKKATSREVVPLLRQLVLERDNYICQKCGATTETAQLHVHHEKSYTLNKIMANDPDNCITLCKKCHKWIHSQEGCTYFKLQCQRKEEN